MDPNTVDMRERLVRVETKLDLLVSQRTQLDDTERVALQALAMAQRTDEEQKELECRLDKKDDNDTARNRALVLAIITAFISPAATYFVSTLGS